MNKYTKWSIIGIIVAGLAFLGVRTFVPHENKELDESLKSKGGSEKDKTLPVKIAVITGNVFETLSLIDGVADDEEVGSSPTGGCGKMVQYPLNVAMGGPHIRVSAMNVQ